MSKLLTIEKENRRIGSFELPVEYSSDEENWFEPESVSEIKLKSKSISGVSLRTGSHFTGVLNYLLESTGPETQKIALKVTLDSVVNAAIDTCVYEIDEMEFARDVHEIILNYQTEEDIKSMNKGREQLNALVQERLLKEHTIMLSGHNDLWTKNAYGVLHDKEGIPRSFADKLQITFDGDYRMTLICSDMVGYLRADEDFGNLHIYENDSQYIINSYNIVKNQSASAIGSVTLDTLRFESINNNDFVDHEAVLTEQKTHKAPQNNEDFLMTDFIVSRCKFVQKPSQAPSKNRRRTIDIL